MKQVLFVLALLFLLEWAYTTKIKPFIQSEFDFGRKKESSKCPGTDTVDFNTGSFTYGLDISRYQGTEMSFLDEKKDSLSFVICKATQGSTEKDSDFDQNWNMIRSKQFTRGAYHFYVCREGAISQANNFLKTMGTISPEDLPPAIDIESPEVNNACPGVRDSIIAFLHEVEKRTKKKPMIYVNLSDGDNLLSDPRFAEYPLWVAHPSPNNVKAPGVPHTWREIGWKIWQRSDSYRINQIINDFDVFNGTKEELKQFIKNSIRGKNR